LLKQQINTKCNNNDYRCVQYKGDLFKYEHTFSRGGIYATVMAWGSLECPQEAHNTFSLAPM